MSRDAWLPSMQAWKQPASSSCQLQALWTLHADGSEKLPMGQNSTYDRIKRKVAAALDRLGDDRQFQWS